MAHNKIIASLRIHVERCIERMKNWHIFDNRIPLTLAPIASDVFIIIGALTNFLPPLIDWSVMRGCRNIHTSPMEGFFHLNASNPPPPPWIFQVSFTLSLNFGCWEPPSPRNFQWPFMGWVWIFSGTMQQYFTFYLFVHKAVIFFQADNGILIITFLNFS